MRYFDTPVANAQTITSLSTVKTLTVPTGANRAVVQCEGQAVRWYADGTAPTSSVGMLLAVGSELHLSRAEALAIQFIETTASATLRVSYTRDS